MFVTHFQKAITYIRETQEIALFTTMADARLSAIFRISPLFYVVLPFIGLILTLNALINGYQLAKSSNRNFDRWFLFASSAICAVLASISLYGAVITKALSMSFAAGPWFFFSSLMVALSHQCVMFGINLYSAFESPKNSIQRMHYLQAALSNLFVMTLLASALGAVVFTLLFPIAPAVGTLFSISAILFTGMDILWHVAPLAVKQKIKGWLHLSKPSLIEDTIVNQQEILKRNPFKEKELKHHRMFTCCDYTAVIRTMDMGEARAFLFGLIRYKLNMLQQKGDPQNETINNKISLLSGLFKIIENHQEISKKEVLASYPLAFQSFWTEKGEIEQIIDAMILFQKRHQAIELDNLTDQKYINYG